MEFLVQDTASQIGVSLCSPNASHDVGRNTQPSQDPSPPLLPNQQSSPNAPLFALESYTPNPQTSQRSPFHPPTNDNPHQIPPVGYASDRSMPSTSVQIGNTSCAQVASAVYGVGTTTQPRAPPLFIGPLLHETLNSFITCLPNQVPTLKRLIFEVEDEATEYALRQEFLRINSASQNLGWMGIEFTVVRHTSSR